MSKLPYDPIEGYDAPLHTITGEPVMEITKILDDKIVAAVRQTVQIDIDKRELIKLLKDDRHQYKWGYRNGFNRGYAYGYDKAKQEEPHGHWIRSDLYDFHGYGWYCSSCGNHIQTRYPDYPEDKHCRFCGAHMEEKNET